MEKVIREGKVAILYSPNYGAGWYSFNPKYPQLLFSPIVVEMVEQNRRSEITKEWLLKNLGISVCAGGASDLEICWLPEGTAFQIEEYDGFESICTIEDLLLIA